MGDQHALPGVDTRPGFRTFQVDSPWPERGGGQIKRGADRHYPLLPVRSIPTAIMESPLWRPAENAHLYFWTTNTYLKDAFWVIEQIGFRYVTNLCWTKARRMDHGVNLQVGIGQYFRGSHELCLFAVRGSGMDESVFQDNRSIPSVILEPRTTHSKKPSSIYSVIESRSKGPYAEIFSREERPGWSSWGSDDLIRKVLDDVGLPLHDGNVRRTYDLAAESNTRFLIQPLTELIMDHWSSYSVPA